MRKNKQQVQYISVLVVRGAAGTAASLSGCPGAAAFPTIRQKIQPYKKELRRE